MTPVANRYLRLRSIYALLLLLATALGPARAGAEERFHFEGPYLTQPGRILKDHALARVGDTWHCFYIQGEIGASQSSEDSLGHATSRDLREWTLRGPALETSADGWDSRNVWAPALVPQAPNDPEQVLMIYTGVDGNLVQRTGFATAPPPLLGGWSKWSQNPILEPDSTVYAWSPDTPYSSFRDPFYFQWNGKHHLLHTAQIRNGTTGSKGCIHHATSTNMVVWNEEPPLLVHNGYYLDRWRDLESPQLHRAAGYWHLFFSEYAKAGVRYLRSDSLDAGWDMNEVVVLDQGNAAELVPVGEDTFMMSRYGRQIISYDGSEFWYIRIDSLRIDPLTALPEKVEWDVLAQDWPVRTGTAFEAQPTFGENPVWRGEAPVGVVGHGWISTYEHFQGPLTGRGNPGETLGGGATGTMQSRVFTLSGIRMDLLVAGGGHPDAWVGLMDAEADTALYQAHGHGGFDLQPVSWDLAGLQGRSVYLQIEDAGVDADAWIAVDEIVEVPPPTPAPPLQVARRARLLANVPNPFNPRTLLRWSQEESATVSLALYDARGRRVRAFPPRRHEAGEHELRWDGTDQEGRAVASGVYRVVLRLEGRVVDGRPVTLLR